MPRASRVILATAILAGFVGFLPGTAHALTGGTFKSMCTYSHTAADDPIVKPGLPGASHSHDFFGNESTDAFSTIATLDAGTTTCSFPEDKSGYWAPSVLVNGVRVDPDHVSAYYTVRSANPPDVQSYPHGLEIVAGDSMATTPQSLKIVSWTCGVASDEDPTVPSASVPTCLPGQELQLKVQFPECWDGVSVDSINHKSHMVYLASSNATCPVDHPVLVPSLGLIAHYPTLGGPGVTLASGGQYSGHADFFNAWDATTLQGLVASCLRTGTDCHSVGARVDDTSGPESGPLTFTVSLSEPSAFTVTVDYTTTNDEAVAPGDYKAVSGKVTFPPYALSKTVTVSVVEDSLAENDEKLFLELSNPTNAVISVAKAAGTILDDDAGPTISAGDASIVEPAGGTKVMVCTLTLSTVADRDVTVQYRTADTTAKAPGDYKNTTGTATFHTGTTTAAVKVTVNADTDYTEGTETLRVLLANPVSATIADGTAVLTITDVETVPKLYVNDTTTTESGDATFSVTLASATSMPVSVDYTTEDGSAVAPADYHSATGTLVIPAGEVAASVTVSVVHDSLSEADETFQLIPSNPVNAMLITNATHATIVDDNALPTLKISDATVVEPVTGTRGLRFTVTLVGASGQAVTFDWATVNGSASAPGDYQAASASMTLPIGTSTKTISVTVNADSVTEGVETLQVVLTNVVGATLSDGTGVGKITPS